MLRFRLSRNVLSTISPPVRMAARYKPTPGRPLLDMSQGVPGVPPPESLRSAIANASAAPDSFGYCRWDGEPALPETDINSDDIALTAGCNLAFVAAAMSLASQGDEVILPAPWMDLNLLGIKAVALPTRPEDGFLPSVEKAKSLITPHTKAIALVTPNNPTGATYPPSLIASFFFLAQDTLLHLFSFSKSYCMPGHRLGAIVASPAVLASTKKVLDCLQICAPRPVQMALATMLQTDEVRGFVKDNAGKIAKRHELFRQCLPEGWEIGAQGGYFAFVKHPWEGVESEELCRRLAEEAGVVTLPASFFTQAQEGSGGGEAQQEQSADQTEHGRWIRFSVANVDDESVRKVCERLSEFDPR
ncbi:aminotransferase [Coprinopsis sp. MPI-PUGE-AT-0042]|nr:aminotransferase [Coprinopsis sp. MPI-PUGE-AT-0042]